jgi:hypothetical protein
MALDFINLILSTFVLHTGAAAYPSEMDYGQTVLMHSLLVLSKELSW